MTLTRQALSAAGFDLACGFMHADRRGRDALVYDLMELARPSVDDLVLTFLQATFHAGDFTGSRMARIASILSWRGPWWRRALCHSSAFRSMRRG